MDIFSIAAKIKLDTADFTDGISKAGSKVSGFSKKIGSGLATAAKVGAAAITTMATTTLAGIGAVVKATDSIADYGDNIDKMSQKMGISATAYQEWDAVMKHSGTSMESLKAGMKTLANAVESGNKAFGRLGITEKQIAKMNNEELFAAVIEGLQNVEDETERTYLAGQLLGRGATELGALLNQSAEETQAMKDRVHELGGVMSDEAVKQAAAYKDQLQDMKTAMSGFSRNILSDFMPMITEVMSGISDIFSGDKDKGFGKINSGIKQITDKVTKALPEMLELGGSMVTAIADGLLQNLPMLVKTGAGLFKSLFDAALDGINSITALISADDGQGGGGVAGIINGAINFVVENIPAMLNAGLDLFSALLNNDNLGNIISNIFKAIPDLISGIIGDESEGTGLLGHKHEMVQGAIKLFQQLVSNVPKIVESLMTNIAKLVVGILDELLNPENLAAVLQAGIELGAKLLEGIGQGLKGVAKTLNDKWKDITMPGWRDQYKVLDDYTSGGPIFGVTDSFSTSGTANIASEIEKNPYILTAYQQALLDDPNAVLGLNTAATNIIINAPNVTAPEVVDEIVRALQRGY